MAFTYGVLGFVAAAQEMLLNPLVIMASGNCVQEFKGIVAKKETVLNSLSPQGSAKM